MQTVKEVTAASSFNMSQLLTALWMAGKISWSPFNERYEQHTMAELPSVKDTQDTLTKEVERLCILGVLKQQQASN
jgi:hypothetical protein